MPKKKHTLTTSRPSVMYLPRRYASLFSTLLLVVALFAVSIGVQHISVSIPNKIQDTITLSLGIIYEALPFVVLGVFLSVMVQQFLRHKDLDALLPRNTFLKKLSLALIGVFLPVCECGNVPLSRGFIKKGVNPADSLSFLLAAPIVSPITIYTTLIAFSSDSSVAVIRTLGGLSIALFISYLFSKDESILTESYQTYCDSAAIDNTKRSSQKKASLASLSHSFYTELQSLMPSLVTGSVVAGIIQTTIPRSLLLTLSSQPLIAIITLLILAFIVSICANVDAFFALALSSIFPISAIIGFLIFGPLVDIKILSMLSTTYKKEVLIKISATAFLLSFLIAMGVHYVL